MTSRFIALRLAPWAQPEIWGNLAQGPAQSYEGVVTRARNTVQPERDALVTDPSSARHLFLSEALSPHHVREPILEHKGDASRVRR
jgi:hypothetical protein